MAPKNLEDKWSKLTESLLLGRDCTLLDLARVAGNSLAAQQNNWLGRINKEWLEPVRSAANAIPGLTASIEFTPSSTKDLGANDPGNILPDSLVVPGQVVLVVSRPNDTPEQREFLRRYDHLTHGVAGLFQWAASASVKLVAKPGQHPEIHPLHKAPQVPSAGVKVTDENLDAIMETAMDAFLLAVGLMAPRQAARLKEHIMHEIKDLRPEPPASVSGMPLSVAICGPERG